MNKIQIMTALAVGAAALGAGIAACAPATVTKAAQVPSVPASFTPPPPVTTDANGASCPVSSLTTDGYCPGSTPSPSASSPASGPLGTTFTVTTQNAAGQPVSYQVTAVKVDQRSALSPYDSLGNPADHLAAVKFTISGVTGQSSDDAASDATAITGSGSKYVRGQYLSTVEIAALIRAEIKVARTLGKVKAKPGEIALPDPVTDAPAQVKIGVRVPHYGSIEVTVKNVPRDWGYDPQGGRDVYGEPCESPSRALYELGEALCDLAGAWNYDNSDAMTDYFDTGYYLHIQDEQGYSIKFMPSRMKYDLY